MAKIYYYTSTGNSLYAADRIGRVIGADVVPMNEMVCNESVIGFVFPAYFWGLPRKVEGFIRNLKITNNNPYIFSIVTYGGVIAGVNGQVRELLREKRQNLDYANSVKCVENYIVSYKVNDTDRKMNQSEKKISLIAMDLKEGMMRQDSSYSLLNRMIHGFYPSRTSDSKMEISSQCTGCGVCEQVCPVKNIVLEESVPVFQGNCDHCLGCIHHCPVQAINWNYKTQGRKRYRHRGIGLKQLKQNRKGRLEPEEKEKPV